jgi:hypothetical protein
LRIFRALSIVVATAALAVGLVPAATATSSTSAGGAGVLGGECGSGYTLVGLHPVTNQATGRVDLHMEVYWSSATKRNCLIARHFGDSYGKFRNPSLAKIRPGQPPGGVWPACPSVGCDRGNYAFYAGPVYTPAGVDMTHRCVDIGGMAGIHTDLILYGLHCG